MMRAFVTLLLTVSAVAQVAQQLFNRTVVVNAAARNAVCQDGSEYSYYYRNCTANWDSKGFDYCKGVDRWLLVFGSGALDGEGADGAYCYSPSSCAARSRNLTSSTGLPDTAFPDGLVLPYAEANPNLYKSPALVLPYCSSDLWLADVSNSSTGSSSGGGLHFRGASILRAVLEDAFTSLPAPTMTTAGSVVVVGGPGIMLQLDAIAGLLRALKANHTGGNSSLDVYGICDGCLLWDLPLFNPAPPCATDSDCPPPLALPAASALWQWRCANSSSNSSSNSSDGWSCLTAHNLLHTIAAAQTPVLIQAQQYDNVMLRAYGAWPLNGSASAAAWAEGVLAPAVRAAVLNASQQGTPYTYTAACTGPVQAMLSPAFYHLPVPMTDQYGHYHSNALAVAVPAFLEDAAPHSPFGPTAFGVYGDNCTTVDCNPACAGY